MNFDPFLVCFLFFVGGHCTFVERYYKSSQNIISTPNSAFEVELETTSELQCAKACTEKRICNSFSFDEKSGSCSMSSGITENMSDRVYYTDCPVGLGYSLWSYTHLTRCLKYVPTQLTHLGALTTCKADNAHLALIDSNDTRILIWNMLVEVGAYTGYIYFDGYDVGDQNIFRSWNGDDLPWTWWAPYNPSHKVGEDCIIGWQSDGYQTRDVHCAQKYPYVCQIDFDKFRA